MLHVVWGLLSMAGKNTLLGMQKLWGFAAYWFQMVLPASLREFLLNDAQTWVQPEAVQISRTCSLCSYLVFFTHSCVFFWPPCTSKFISSTQRLFQRNFSFISLGYSPRNWFPAASCQNPFLISLSYGLFSNV